MEGFFDASATMHAGVECFMRRCRASDLADRIQLSPRSPPSSAFPLAPRPAGTSCRPSNSRNVTSYPIDRSLGTMTRLHRFNGKNLIGGAVRHEESWTAVDGRADPRIPARSARTRGKHVAVGETERQRTRRAVGESADGDARGIDRHAGEDRRRGAPVDERHVVSKAARESRPMSCRASQAQGRRRPPASAAALDASKHAPRRFRPRRGAEQSSGSGPFDGADGSCSVASRPVASSSPPLFIGRRRSPVWGRDASLASPPGPSLVPAPQASPEH